ncbi:hypothetical protein Bca4012_093019 [Brassica carinata]|uniref:Uncharacterized protein n=1 Tax=Brassica carinata TaxID=52824 RepID=A0A8X7PSM3_BRACI|nr:hypothetical protein Bca52824_075257 [Brassica carinata]
MPVAKQERTEEASYGANAIVLWFGAVRCCGKTYPLGNFEVLERVHKSEVLWSLHLGRTLERACRATSSTRSHHRLNLRPSQVPQRVSQSETSRPLRFTRPWSGLVDRGAKAARFVIVL